MGDRVIRKIMEYLKAHRLKRTWQVVLTSLAAVVVFCTTYALILPAITLDRTAAEAATEREAGRKAGAGKATPTNVTQTTADDDDPEADVDLIFDLDYDMSTRRFLTKSARDLGVDVDMGVPEWMLSDWYEVPDFDGELTGIWSKDLLAVAKSQVGYIADYEGRSYYGDWYGKPYDDWDAMFVSWCLDLANVPENVIPRETSATELADRLAGMDHAGFVEAEGHTPEAGDLIFFDTDGDGEADRVGIVAEYNARTGELKVIEGDYRTEVEWYESDTERASSSDAEKATASNAKKANTGQADLATPSGAGHAKPDRDEAATDLATPGDAEKTSQKESPLGATIEKKETPRVTAQEDEDEDDRSYDIISEAAIVSYNLDALLSGEENVAVVAYAIGANENDENSDSSKDLEEYIQSVNEQSNQSASITLNLRTESDSEISGDDDSKVVTTNTKYHLALTIYSSVGFDANTTYTYSLPEGVAVEAATGSITIEGSTVIGTWTVSDDGTVTLAFNDKVAEYQDVEITFTATVTINTTEKTITIGDTTYTVSETTNLAVNKSGNYSGYTKTGGYYSGRTWEIEFSQSGVSLEGTKVTDYATDTQYSLLYSGGDISYNNQHFDTSIPLVITIVDASGATVYTWTVDWSDSNLTLYTLDDDGNVVDTTSTSDRIIGWQYTFPDTVSATDSGGDTVTVDLTTTDWSPYEIHINSKTIFDVVPSAANVRVTYHNRVEVDNGVDKDTAHSSITQATGTYSLNKDWSRGEDGVSVDWSIDVTIPGGSVVSYELEDYMYVNTTGSAKRLIFGEYTENRNMTIAISEGTTINGTKIEAGTYTVYDISGEVPEDALFVYSYVPSVTGYTAYFVLGMTCHCDEDCCDGWEDGGCKNILYNADGTIYCTCWQLDQRAEIQLTYTTPKEKMLELLSTYGYSEKRFYNYASLRTGEYNGDGSLTSTSVISSCTGYVGLALAAKTLSEAPSSENDYTASYEVVINTNHYELTENGADLTITDTLSSSLTFLPGSLVIQATDEDGNITTLTSDDYTYTYDSDTHVIMITIKNPGTNSYTITYDAQMLNANAGATYSNSLQLSWQGEDVIVETDTSYLSEVTTTGATYMVAALKTDEITGESLEGAEFKLYDADGKEKATGTTDESGQVTFKTVSGTGESTLTFATHSLYYLEETDAPEGYTLDSSKHYFYFCDNSGDGSCEICSNMTLPDDLTSDDVTKLIYGGTITITNAQSAYGFTIQKVDSEDPEKTLGGAEFYLYYESTVLDAEGNQTEEINPYYAVLDENNAVISWNSSVDQATKLVVGEDGTVSISGLSAGTYYLEEAKAPDGYNLLSNPITITVTSDGSISVEGEDPDVAEIDDSLEAVVLTVKNTAGYTLPETGGSGSTSFRIACLGLSGCSAYLIYAMRRRKRRVKK